MTLEITKLKIKQCKILIDMNKLTIYKMLIVYLLNTDFILFNKLYSIKSFCLKYVLFYNDNITVLKFRRDFIIVVVLQILNNISSNFTEGKT